MKCTLRRLHKKLSNKNKIATYLKYAYNWKITDNLVYV